MDGLEIKVREASRDDLPQIVEIYNHSILHEKTPFATEPRSVDSRLPWFGGFDGVWYHLLVAQRGDVILGWASSSRYRPTPAFDATVEASIYIHPEGRGGGIGALLYSNLLTRLAESPVHSVLAGIAQPNPASVALHRKFGFEEVGTFREYACKTGVRISSTWFQKLMA